MDKHPARAARLAQCPVCGDAAAGLFEATELLDVEVDQLAGVLALLADYRRRRVLVLGPDDTHGPQDAANGGRRNACFVSLRT